MQKLLFLLVCLLIWGPVSYGQVATKVRYGVTKTTDSLNETRPGYALIPSAGKALRALIDANTAAINGRLAGTSGTNTGDQTLSQSGNRVTLSGGGGFFDLPTGGGSSLSLLVITDPGLFATATTDQVLFEGDIWLRSAGAVQTDPVEQNGRYTAVQYNGSGAFHYDRQYKGMANFRWWARVGSMHNRLRAALSANITAGIQVDSGKYYFNSHAWTRGNWTLRGDVNDPGKVQFIVSGSTNADNEVHTRLIRGWYNNDGTVGRSNENILIEGITFVQASSATISTNTDDPAGSYGPVCFEGGGHRNITIRRCAYVQQSKTAVTNFITMKAGNNLPMEGITIEDNYSSNPDTLRGRMFTEILNQQDHPNSDKGIGRNIIIQRNYIRGFAFGTSIAGHFAGNRTRQNKYGDCTYYGHENAGDNIDADFTDNQFFGTHNVFFVSNYHGETNNTRGDYAIPTGSGQRYINNRTLGYVPGRVEIRGGGDLVFSDNQLNMSGEVWLRRNSLGGTVSTELKNNRLVTNATHAQQNNKAVLYLFGATNVRGTGNTFIRTSADTQPLIQAVSSSDENYNTGSTLATGTNSTGSIFTQNFLTAGATPTSYFSASSPNSLSQGSNYTGAGALINN